VQDVFSGDIQAILKDRRIVRLFRHFHFHFWKWVLPVIGALVIISPLPDEIGLTMLGLSRVRTIVMLPLTFALNFVGILLLNCVGIWRGNGKPEPSKDDNEGY
jgi:membrane protein DedA with SNARE-associated domain